MPSSTPNLDTPLMPSTPQLAVERIYPAGSPEFEALAKAHNITKDDIVRFILSWAKGGENVFIHGLGASGLFLTHTVEGHECFHLIPWSALGATTLH